MQFNFGFPVGRGTRGSGNIIRKTFDFSGYTHVSITSAFVVEIICAEQFAVAVEADDNVMDAVKIRMEGEMLHVALADSSRFYDFTHRAFISMPLLTLLSLHGSSQASIGVFSSPSTTEISVNGSSRVACSALRSHTALLNLSGSSEASCTRITSNTVRISVAAASKFSCTEVASDSTVLHLSSASKGSCDQIAAHVFEAVLTGASNFHCRAMSSQGLTRADPANFSKLKVNVHGASKVLLAGAAAADAQITAHGASKADMAGLALTNVNAVLNGCSTCSVFTNGKLATNLRGASRLLYFGAPNLTDASVHEASTLTRG